MAMAADKVGWLSEAEVRRLMALVRWHLRTLADMPDFEDLLAHAYRRMWIGLTRVGPESPYARTTIATASANWARLDFLRTRESVRHRRSRRGHAVAEWVPLVESDPDRSEPLEDRVLAKVESDHLLQTLREYLRPRPLLRAIVERTVLDNERDSDVASDLGITVKELNRRRKAGLERFREGYRL